MLLLSEREDRDLSAKEVRFLARHREVCPECESQESSMHCSLNMLRAATIDVEPAAHFDERLIRRVKIQRVKESLSYWTPGLIGCAVAAIAIFATLHVLTLNVQKGSVVLPAGEARRGPTAFPSLELSRLPHFDR